MSDAPSGIIALEEHFMHPSLADHFGDLSRMPPQIRERLFDWSELRLSEMNAAGIDIQVLSHQSPGTQRLASNQAVQICRLVNDALAQIIRTAPTRFSGFAMLPTTAPTIPPNAAADELKRCVEELGLKGAMIHGLSQGQFVDTPEFWPIFAQAERLNVPIYLHPAEPDPTITARYYAPYDQTHTMIKGPAWGFGVEAGTQAVRLILSGIFERHPALKIILGHMGEAIPFLLPRIQDTFSRPGQPQVDFAKIFQRNFYVTTSGFFSSSALKCCLDTLGNDKVLFAVDWPYASNEAGVDWLNSTILDDATKRKIFGENAQGLLAIP